MSTFKNKFFKTDGFGLLFFLILFSIILSAGLDNKIIDFFSESLQIIIVFLAIRASGINKTIQRKIIFTYLALIISSITAITIYYFANPHTVSISDALRYSEINGAIIGILLSSTITILILFRLYKHQKINITTVFGALCIYLQIGLLFTFIYLLMGAISNGHFFVGALLENRTIYPYYSFSTLTTVGFGDYTASSNLGRMLSAFEAIIGQLYLVGGVALVVGNIGRQRSVNTNFQKNKNIN